jgi:hypothetical protein
VKHGRRAKADHFDARGYAEAGVGDLAVLNEEDGVAGGSA